MMYIEAAKVRCFEIDCKVGQITVKLRSIAVGSSEVEPSVFYLN